MHELVKAFENVTTASISDVLDAHGFRGYMDAAIQARTVDQKIVGPAVTVKEIRAAQKQPPQHAVDAIEHAPEGSVIVISIEDGEDVACWGGLMSAGAAARKLAGAVLDGGVRDVTEIQRDYQFPVYARSVVPSTTVGRHIGVANNVPVVCGNVAVEPGDIIVADADGVVVVPRGLAEQVLREAQEIDEREARMAKEIRESGSLARIIERYSRI